MDDGVEALVGFVGTHGDTLELLELAEEVFDQMTPLVHLGIERQGLGAAWMLGNDDLGAALVEVGDDGVAVERLVGDQRAEAETVDERRHSDGVEAVAGQQDEAHEIAESIGERQDLGRPDPLGRAAGLAPSPPFVPWPWRGRWGEGGAGEEWVRRGG